MNGVCPSLAGAQAISAGDEHSMLLKRDGSVWATGDNEHGQLGDGTTAYRNTFVEVVPPAGQCTTAKGRDEGLLCYIISILTIMSR